MFKKTNKKEENYKQKKRKKKKYFALGLCLPQDMHHSIGTNITSADHHQRAATFHNEHAETVYFAPQRK